MARTPRCRGRSADGRGGSKVNQQSGFGIQRCRCVVVLEAMIYDIMKTEDS